MQWSEFCPFRMFCVSALNLKVSVFVDRAFRKKLRLEEGMATHSSILAWRIPWIEEAGRVGHK